VLSDCGVQALRGALEHAFKGEFATNAAVLLAVAVVPI